MSIMNSSDIHCQGLRPFDIKVSYAEFDKFYYKNTDYAHVHNECEIYINIAGKVSFMVENRIYPIFPGSIIITRPYEYHHCICHTEDIHKHFCIWFSSENNEGIFDMFFKRELGKDNLLVLSADKHKKLFALCHDLLGKSQNEFAKLYHFINLINFLNTAETPDLNTTTYPHDVYDVLDYINSNFTEQISISDLAKQTHVSLSSLERHFYEALRMTPSSYLKSKRLSNAVEMLYNGASVTDACYKSGFADQSKFINLFKKNYGFTPLQYKKKVAGDKANSNKGIKD